MHNKIYNFQTFCVGSVPVVPVLFREFSYMLLEIFLSYEHSPNHTTLTFYVGDMTTHHDLTSQRSQAGTQGSAVLGGFVFNVL